MSFIKNILKYFETALIFGVLIIVSVVLVLAFIDIVHEIKTMIMTPPGFTISANALMDLFSLILLLLIGLELLETIKAYLKEDIVHVEFIILVAIIAIARKVIVWDFNKYSVEELLGLTAMIVGLGLTYFLIKKADLNISFPKKYKKDKEKSD